ncbi:hypothetical protein ACP179_06485 [Xenorhabdus stockiae]|uniref:hypothetical protein n=1 Tax=Xenorhabdus stockiae TaxID=351614 RepID=UPI003CF209BD
MKKIMVWGGVITIIIFSAWFGRHVPFSKQWPLFEALRVTAAIIFAVVGAWFAIIYPERLKKAFRGGVDGDAAVGIHRLFTPIVHSTAILSVVLLVGIIAPLLKQFNIIMEYRTVLRGISYGLLVSLTLWQLVTVVYSLLGPDMVKSYTLKQEKSQKAANSILHPKIKKE